MNKRILIIEDDPQILDILEIIFQDDGFDVIASRTGLSLDQITLSHPDLILLDVRIAGFAKTGAEICSELKAFGRTRHLPVLLLSAEHDLAKTASECGANGHLSKPFEIAGLMQKVHEMLL